MIAKQRFVVRFPTFDPINPVVAPVSLLEVNGVVIARRVCLPAAAGDAS